MPHNCWQSSTKLAEIHADAVVLLTRARDGHGLDVDGMLHLLGNAFAEGHQHAGGILLYDLAEAVEKQNTAVRQLTDAIVAAGHQTTAELPSGAALDGPADAAAAFELAGRFHAFTEQLRHAIEHLRYYPGSYEQRYLPWLSACWALAKAAQRAGAAGLPAIRRGVDVYEWELEDLRERDATASEARQAEFAEAERKHQLAVQVECPYCGAQPGNGCRTAGPSGQQNAKGIHDHADRYRAACHLLKPEAEGQQ